MKLLMIAGFLGSGKTTLLLEIAKILIKNSYRVAIVENEVGQIGIDGRYIEQAGLEVQELYGGCICCTLRYDLRTTLNKIAESIKPDWVLLEPTGAAYPGDIVKNVKQDCTYIKNIWNIILIDATRYKMLLEMMTPILLAQINSANIIAINKIDEVEKLEIDSIVDSLKGLRKDDTSIVSISAEKKINIETLIKNVL